MLTPSLSQSLQLLFFSHSSGCSEAGVYKDKVYDDWPNEELDCSEDDCFEDQCFGDPNYEDICWMINRARRAQPLGYYVMYLRYVSHHIGYAKTVAASLRQHIALHPNLKKIVINVFSHLVTTTRGFILSHTPPATDRVPYQSLEAAGLQERARSQDPAGSREPTDLQTEELIPSLEPCLSPASYSLSLVSVLLRLPHCPPYSFITVHCSATPPQ